MNAEITSAEIEQLPLKLFTEKAYLDYSMYVILDRALPHIGDGLKPVQRRIVYAMSELALNAQAKPKKSARTVGDVLGKYHPHGDLACYEAMVLMAQPFSYRYPLVDGHGNWGSQDDPKSFAAMRYTEARLSRFADVLLGELAQGTTDWTPNFDGTLDEPVLLPARLPHVLLNGATGIAVGMATDIPPHNAREITRACIALLDDADTTVGQLCEHVLGPDLPTEAEIITPRAELQKLYENGTGSYKMRARYEIEDGAVVITALPHQVSGAKVLEQIAQQMNAKKLPMVEDLRDESDHTQPTRLVIVPRSNRVDIDAMMAHLFATTDLERSYRVNLNMIGLNGRPAVKNLREILSEWLTFRTQTVRRRLQWRLDKIDARLHILDGLLIAYLNLDEVIRIIRTEDKPKPALMARFDLSDTQAEAILDTKLRHLARLEEMKIRAEQAELRSERDALADILSSEKKLKKLLRKELTEDAQQHGDDRRSPLVERAAAQALDETALLPTEPVTIVLSEKGWIRAAKGHEVDATTLSYKAGDALLSVAQGRSNQLAVFLDNTGRAYALPAHTLPSARGQGEPLTGRVAPPPGAQFVCVLIGNTDDLVVLAADNGYGFIARLEDLHARNKNGKALLTAGTEDRALSAAHITHLDTDLLAAVTRQGKLLVFPTRDLPQLAKGKGNKIIQLADSEDRLVAVCSVPQGLGLVITATARQARFKPSELAEYSGQRARSGLLLPKNLRHVKSLGFA